MKIRSCACFALCAVFAASVAQASYKMGEERPVSTSRQRPLNETKKIKFPSGRSVKENPETTVMSNLSDRYSIPVDRLEYFRGLHQGYEEIVPSLIIAREAQVEPGRILKMRMEGTAWKSIAESFSVDLKPLNQEVLEVLKPIRAALPAKALTERPANRN